VNVLHLNASDWSGGAARSAFRLNAALCAAGAQSMVFVRDQSTDAANVFRSQSKVAKALNVVRPYVDWAAPRLYGARTRFSPGIVPDRLASMIDSLRPDVVNLHWVAAGFMQIETVARIRRPLVWTMHDSWPFTGGCHLPGECRRYMEQCGSCPALRRASEMDLSRLTWKRKYRAWRSVQLTVVAPSRWLARSASDSALFRSRKVAHIPNGVDVRRFQPLDQEFARRALGIVGKRPILLFSAFGGAADANKGFDLLLRAASRLSRTAPSGGRPRILLAGTARMPEGIPPGVEVICAGRVQDEATSVLLNAAADVVACPSRQENLPNVVLEALACGRPVVGFDVGGMSDLIRDGENGRLVKPFDDAALANAIVWVLADDGRRQGMCDVARRIAETEFSLDEQARRYLELYRDVIVEQQSAPCDHLR
jgi:glycosyltransferase involved in cell wall biosynthesis